MTKLKLLAATAALAAAVVLAGCGASTNNHTMGGMSSPMMSTGPSVSSTASPAAGPHNQADVMFSMMMTPHHRQAIEMADLLLAKKNINPKVTDLATRIKAAQTPEIAQMNGWLSAWGQHPAPSSMGGMNGMGNSGGTMSQADMDALKNATGDKAARLFLTGMTKHHQGAITMGQTELDHGQNPDTKKLAQNIITSQTAEIIEMKKLLAK